MDAANSLYTVMLVFILGLYTAFFTIVLCLKCTCVFLLAISKVYPDYSGTRLVFVDEKGDAYLHNPVSLQSIGHCTSIHVHVEIHVHVCM